MAQYTPYRKAAASALMSWNGLSQEEAEAKIKSESYDTLEGQVWASGSMKYAVQGLAKELNLTEEEATLLEQVVLGGDAVELSEKDEKFLQVIAQKADAVPNKSEMVIRVLSAIHDGWVKDNAKKFAQEGREAKKYQHLPLEMIGWKEAKADLLFLSPILESLGVDAPEAELEEAYGKIASEFYVDHEMVNEEGIDKEAVAREILKGAKFYPALSEKNSAKTAEEAALVAEQSMAKMAGVKIKA